MAELHYNGIDGNAQANLRVDTFWFIDALSRLLNFYRYDRYRCSATATVMCQRLFSRQRPYYDHREVATACMMIAKRNYTPKDPQIDEICKYSFLLIHSGESFTKMVAPDGWKERMLWVERMVFSFLQHDDMKADLPHDLFHYHTRFIQPALRHFCYQFLNDGLLTTAFLLFPRHYLVAGALYAGRTIFDLPFRYDWWEQCELNPDMVQEVGDSFLESQEIRQQSRFILPSDRHTFRNLHTRAEELSQKLAGAEKEIQRLTEALAKSHSTTN